MAKLSKSVIDLCTKIHTDPFIRNASTLLQSIAFFVYLELNTKFGPLDSRFWGLAIKVRVYEVLKEKVHFENIIRVDVI